MAHRWRNRIRTIDPLLRKPLLGVADRTRLHERRSHLQVQVRDGDACLEWLPIAFPFAVGPRVRIRLPPAESLRTIGSAGREPPASDAARCGGITALFRRGSARGIWQYPQIPVTAGFLSIRRVTLSPLPHLRERGAYRAGGNLKHLSDERYSKHDGGVPETRALRRPPG